METIEALEAQLQELEGEERAKLRRKIRRLRRKTGVPMERVTGRAPRATRSRSRQLKFHEGETPKQSKKRLREELTSRGLIEMKENVLAGDIWVMFPMNIDTEVALNKFEQRFPMPPLLHFSFYRTLVNTWLALGPIPPPTYDDVWDTLHNT